MRLLLLGGTAFLGRAVAIEAMGRGHDVTCLARGSAPPPDGVTFVRADRDEPDALAEVRGQDWDAVLDVTRQPGQVRRAVAELRTPHWVFVSTANVYAPAPGLRPVETDPLLEPLAGEVMESMEDYGPAKVACEQAAADGMAATGGTATLARAGLIAGPGDESGRVGYWPWRFAHPSGSDVIVPDDPDFPVAFIDVRDLAGWLVDAAEQRLEGAYNVTGEVVSLTDVLAAAADAAGASVPARPVAPQTLAELGVAPWMGPRSLPLWIDDPDLREFAALNISRAVGSGLRLRPLATTLADTLAWEETRHTPRRAGLTDDEEREIRAALDAG
ncbi:NAD-dependent epimerase/dehydratase family protein [Serinicoccus kebangsaanensis]|uniref:NAD-dependent epimerase/dehydratase family protein n=1 Tax=Serinicoccus kebangsaanensis TaxID=2602069 RepID=UPI00124C4BF8|nr:NAD-dependent epimerase/dehydratase family protein [Serinicoccus kebangsaanensis]